MIYATLKVLPPDPEIGWMISKTVKLNCLTLGELDNEPIFKKNWSVPLSVVIQSFSARNWVTELQNKLLKVFQ